MATKRLTRTDLTRLRRLPARGTFDRQAIYAIVDATPLCHLGYRLDDKPVVIPTCHWRDGDRIYWHGSRISRTLKAAENAEVCLTVTHFDGLVLARSGFHHSANYRAAMIFGKATLVEDADAKLGALERFIEGLFPGRWDTLRAPSRKEMNATTVLSLPIEEASAKIRSGPPSDLDEDLDHPTWAGVIPVSSALGEPVPCEHNPAGLETPDHVSNFNLGGDPTTDR